MPNTGRGRGRGRGRGAIRGRGAPARVRAATTIQQAYRNRRQFRRNLQPFTETKKQQGAGSISGNLQTTSAFTCVLPEKYYFQTQGTGSDQMIGDSVYGRYCGLKLRLGFPQGDDSINIATRLHVYFCTVYSPLAATEFTSPAADAITKLNLRDHVGNQLKQFYNQKLDRMTFNDRLQGFRIDKSVLVKPDRNHQIGRLQTPFMAGTAASAGGPPDVFIEHTWDIKQKLHYEPVLASSLGTETHYLNRPGKAGYKCMVIFNPDFAGQDSATDTRIQYETNDCFWMGDS